MHAVHVRVDVLTRRLPALDAHEPPCKISLSVNSSHGQLITRVSSHSQLFTNGSTVNSSHTFFVWRVDRVTSWLTVCQLVTTPSHFPVWRVDRVKGSCYLTPSTPASHIKWACTRWGVVKHHSGFGLHLALVILTLVLVWLVWCVVTVL